MGFADMSWLAFRRQRVDGSSRQDSLTREQEESERRPRIGSVPMARSHMGHRTNGGARRNVSALPIRCCAIARHHRHQPAPSAYCRLFVRLEPCLRCVHAHQVACVCPTSTKILLQLREGRLVSDELMTYANTGHVKHAEVPAKGRAVFNTPTTSRTSITSR